MVVENQVDHSACGHEEWDLRSRHPSGIEHPKERLDQRSLKPVMEARARPREVPDVHVCAYRDADLR
jgi:hypothetical protein